MSDGFAYIDILFFAMVAAFIAFRLRSVLGRRTGMERQRPNPFDRAPEAGTDKVTPLPDRARSAPAEPVISEPGSQVVKHGITEVRLADPGFDLDSFMTGAKAAFGMIVEAFARGDGQALRPLLADQVYRNFKAAIDQREAAGERLETTILAEPTAELADALLQGSNARIAIRFVSRQINVTRDGQGRVVAGNPDQPDDVVDLWTFQRDVNSRDPNWLLVETASPE